MRRRLFPTDNTSRSGVALIIVLGFLSIMVMMAVAFLIQARTERMVANSTLEAQRGRQLVRSGLTAAMNDYSIELFGQRYILPPPGMAVFPSVAPTAATAVPSGEDKDLGDSGIFLMDGEARQWIPRRYMTQAVTNAVADAEWILVREDPRNGNSPVLGRYAYVCFDMSGGIDANLIALTPGVANVGIKTNGPAKPIARSSARDIGMGLLPETADASTFKALRKGWRGFDNLSELILLTNGKYNGGEGDTALTYKGVKYAYSDEADPDIEDVTWLPPDNPRWTGDKVEYKAGLISSRVSDLVPYSLAAYRGVYDIGGAKWNKPRLCEVGTDWAAVLTDSKLSGQVVSVPNAVKAILDYLDPDSLPQGNPDYPSVEAVPMFNEISMEYNLDFVAGDPLNGVPDDLYLNVKLECETWYPFPSADNVSGASYSIASPTMGGGYEEDNAPDIFIRCAIFPPLDKNTKLTQMGSPISTLGAVVPDFNSGKPKKVSGNIEYRFKVESTNVSSTCKLAIQRFKTNEDKGIYLMSGGTPADLMSFQADLSGSDATLSIGETKTYYSEAEDPRLNHDVSSWKKAVKPDGSMGEINGSAKAVGYGAEGGPGYFMYCRNAAMKTPAELGYVPTGTSWGTIDLCTPAGADALSELVTEPEILDAINSSMGTYYTNGTINPNTTSSNVLISAFAGLNLAEVPNVSKPVKDAITDDAMRSGLTAEMTNDWAAALAASMMTDSASKKIAAPAAGGAFLSGADWVRTAAMKSSGLLADQGLNKNQRESLIRNTWGLFSPNNSLFTVLVIGQAIREGPGQKGDLNLENGEDMITGERRGVALVWRDPYPSTGGYHHEMFVRMFKFLDE